MNMTKRLYRLRDDKMIAGICSGLAKYFNVDPTIVRLIFVVLSFAGLGGLFLYVIAWIIIPEEPYDYEEKAGDVDDFFNPS